MTLLSRLVNVGLAKETTQGTYVAPVRFAPVTSPQPEDVITELKDESLRGNDTLLQGVYGGPSHATLSYGMPHAYTDVLGDHLCAIIGPDTLVAGVSTTLAATSIAGATTISSTASIPLGSTIAIGTGATLEYATTGTPTGAGPYSIPIATPSGGLLYGHTSGVAVVSNSTHTFAQSVSNRVKSYSLTVFDLVETRTAPGCFLGELQIKIDPNGAVQVDPKWTGWPTAVQTNATNSYATANPFLGWQWTLTQNGVSSTRGLSIDMTFKRALDVIHSSDGTQGPREVFPDSLEVDMSLKAIFENNNDLNLFLNYSQVPFVVTLTAPVTQNNAGGSIAFTFSKVSTYKAAANYGGKYAVLDMTCSAIYNATDAGACTAVLKNQVLTQY